jgi:hypothetical protein
LTISISNSRHRSIMLLIGELAAGRFLAQPENVLLFGAVVDIVVEVLVGDGALCVPSRRRLSKETT